jgi:fructose-bisphosphate aldolase class II
MLVRMDVILKKASAKGYGVAAPNILDVATFMACLEVARDLKAPMIIDAGVSNAELIGDAARFFERRFPEVPFAVNLDHGSTFEGAIKCIRAGYTSIMVDRSQAPFEQNVRETAELVKIAHAADVSVEAELGHVGQGVTYDKDRDAGLTRVEDAVEYVKQTQVDCLAVAVGTAHGRYVGTPKLDFERLSAIRKAVSVPLVLHGGSGTGDDNLSKAIELGISKINLGTDLSVGACRKIAAYFEEEEHPSFWKASKLALEGYKEVLARYMKLFGCFNRI